MQFKSILSVLALGLSMVMAEEESTTTSTSTMTRTLTITQCNPTNTDCPSHSTLTSTLVHTYPVSNSSAPVGPTGGYTNSSIIVRPTKSTLTQTQIVEPTQTPTGSQVPTAGAGGLVIQSGLLLAVLGAGMAIVA